MTSTSRIRPILKNYREETSPTHLLKKILGKTRTTTTKRKKRRGEGRGGGRGGEGGGEEKRREKEKKRKKKRKENLCLLPEPPGPSAV